MQDKKAASLLPSKTSYGCNAPASLSCTAQQGQQPAASCCSTHDVAEGRQGLGGGALGQGGVLVGADVIKGGHGIQVLLVAGPHGAAAGRG